MQKSIHTPEYRLLVDLLRTSREELKVSQAQVAEKLGISASQLSKWERRERRIDLLELSRYCDAAGIDLIELIGTWRDRATFKD